MKSAEPETLCATKLITSTRLFKFALARGVNIYFQLSLENKQKNSESTKVGKSAIKV